MSKILAHFYRLLMLLAALSMISAFATVMLGIIGREAGFNIRGLDAYAGYAIAATLFLALPDTFRRGDHIRVTLVLQAIPARIRAVLEYWCLLAGLGLAVFLAWYSVRLAWQSYTFNDVSVSADATPLWIPQIAMALGCVGFAVSLADALVTRLQGREFFVASTGEAAHIE